MKNNPTSSKLTCKGNVPAKLEKKGVDSSSLHNYTLAIEEGEVDIGKAVATIAATVVKTVGAQTAGNGQPFAEVFDAVNGVGYMKKWEEQLVADITATALGTASQSRAYKATLVANTKGLELSDFVSDGKATAKVAVDNPFA